MKTIAKTAIAALVCTGALTASANADTITFDHLEGTAITSGLDNAVDLNNDGINDIEVDVDFLGVNDVADINGIVGQSIGDGIFQDVYVYTELVPDEGTVIKEFFEGETVSSADFVDIFGGNGGNLYINNNGGMLKDGPGDSGYMGFSITTYTPGVTPVCDVELEEVCPVEEEYQTTDRGDGDSGREPIIFDVIYGWVEVTRGSVLFGTVGTGNGSFVAATIPTTVDPNVVPLPAGLPLMLAGLGAFGVLRSRKNKAA